MIRTTKGLALLAIWALGAGIAPAHAQGGSSSYSTWSINGDTVMLRFLLPIADARRVTGTDIGVLTISRFGDYLLDHASVQADGHDCPAIDQGYDIGKVDPLTQAAGLYGFEIFFRCPAPADAQGANARFGNFVLQDRALFNRGLPEPVNFARIQLNGGRFSEQLFTVHRQRAVVPGAGPVPQAGIASFFRLGAGHILERLDHVCLLLGLLLVLRTRTQLRTVMLGLAGGYALSLPAALLAGIAPRASLSDAFIGLLVALPAAWVVTRPLARARLVSLGAAGALLWLAAAALLSHGPWSALLLVGAALFAGSLLAVREPLEQQPLGWLPVAAMFGFLDGFALPAALIPLQLSRTTLLPMLVGFDLGAASMGVLLLLALWLPVVHGWLLRSAHRDSEPATLWVQLSAAALGGLGMFWLVSNLRS